MAKASELAMCFEGVALYGGLGCFQLDMLMLASLSPNAYPSFNDPKKSVRSTIDEFIGRHWIDAWYNAMNQCSV